MNTKIKNEVISELTFEQKIINSIAKILEDEETKKNDLWKSAEDWKQATWEELQKVGLVTLIDITYLEVGKLIFYNMLMAQKDLMLNGSYFETENSRRENPSAVAFRAYSKQLTDWLKSAGSTPMARFSKKVNIKDNSLNKPKHGNTKFINALKSIE